MRVPVTAKPHKDATQNERWTIGMLLAKAVEADSDELRLKFIARVEEINAWIKGRAA